MTLTRMRARLRRPKPRPYVHEGVTERSAPLATLMPAEGELRPAGGDDVEDLAVEAEQIHQARLARESWDDDIVGEFRAAIDAALAEFGDVMDAALAKFGARDAVLEYRAIVAAEDTGEYDMCELRARLALSA